MNDTLPTVPRYVLHEQIGRGGFGEVFRANREGQTEQLAIKLLVENPFVLQSSGRFARECMSMSRVAHRAVAKLRDFSVADGIPFIVTEYVAGKPLRDAVTNWTFLQRVSAMIEILDGLQHVHDQDVFHRDIKPSNIMVRDSDGQPILLDFGLAYIWDGVSSDDLTTRYVGSLGYIPAEVLANPHHRTPGHDVFSAAVTLYEILAGRRPVIDAYVPLSQIEGTLSARIIGGQTPINS